jgi:hypothetical protein
VARMGARDGWLYEKKGNGRRMLADEDGRAAG